MEWTTHMEGGGTLYFRDDGGYVYFEGRRADLEDGLYKIIIEGMQGRKELGTMLPVEGGLKLTRMVSRQTLGQWGCLPVLQVICEKVYGFSGEKGLVSRENAEMTTKIPLGAAEEQTGSGSWVYLEEETLEEEGKEMEEWLPVEEGFSRVEAAEKGVWDAEIREKFRVCSGVLRESSGDGFVLAVPFDVNQAFPVMSLFCFSTLKKIGGGDFLLFSFGKDGRPRFPT